MKYEEWGILLGLDDLINAGVDKSVVNNDGETAYQLLIKNEEKLKELILNTSQNSSKAVQKRVLKISWDPKVELLK